MIDDRFQTAVRYLLSAIRYPLSAFRRLVWFSELVS